MPAHAHHHARHPHTHAPSAASKPPTETVLATVGGWTFIGLTDASPIRRQSGGNADQLRLAFLRFVLPNTQTAPIDTFAQQAGARLTSALPDLPNRYRTPATSTTAPPSIGLPKGGLPAPPSLRAPPHAVATAAAPPLADLVTAAAVLMRTGLLVVDGPPKPAVTRSTLKCSPDGKRFIMGEEGDGSHLYWPKNASSGVTVGPGYDMGSRDPFAVRSDLVASGVDPKMATAAAGGAGLTGAPAGAFAGSHHDDVVLTPDQQNALFEKVIPTYEAAAAALLPADLKTRIFQHEFDAVLSLTFNMARPGHHDCIRDIRALDFVKAAPAWLTLVGGGPGIPDRRRREVGMLRDAIYECKPLRPLSPTPGTLRPSGHNRPR